MWAVLFDSSAYYHIERIPRVDAVQVVQHRILRHQDLTADLIVL